VQTGKVRGMTNPHNHIQIVSPTRKATLFLGTRFRYWRIGFLGFGVGMIGILMFHLDKMQYGGVGSIAYPLAALLCGCIASAATAYFDKKALAKMDIDVDAAYQQNIFQAEQVRTIHVDGTREAIFQKACEALFEYGALIETRDLVTGLIAANTPQTWKGYGERISISIFDGDPCKVSIRSVPRYYALRFTATYGRSWENVHAMSTYMTTGKFPANLQGDSSLGASFDDAINTPPSVMEAGAWPRLVANTTLYAMLWLMMWQSDKLKILVGVAAITVSICLEVIAFLRFRHFVRSKQRSDAQKLFEAVLNMFPGWFVAITLVEPQQEWNSASNLIPLALVFSMAFITWAVIRQHTRQRAERDVLRAAREKAELERQLSEAKLVALSAQIEPHFLFNTLASIQYLIRNDANKAGEMTSDLIRYLRLALPRMKQATARLADELDLVRAYLGIMQIRMGARLQFAIDSPDDLSDVQIPTMTLITLAENAIKHGLEQKPDGGMINLCVSKAEQDLRLEVADTGGGFSTAASGTGIGLANIRERLNTLYGNRAHLELEANQPSGVKAILIIPIERK
jgi:two-component sensor histidine kinase